MEWIAQRRLRLRLDGTGEDVLTVVIAAYAAVVATRALVWPILRARREHRSIVRVRTSWEGGRGGEKVVVNVANFSSHPVSRAKSLASRDHRLITNSLVSDVIDHQMREAGCFFAPPRLD